MEILGDRGPLIRKAIHRFIEAFNVVISNAPPYRPDWKGIVERIFGEMNIRVFNWLPGYVVPERDLLRKRQSAQEPRTELPVTGPSATPAPSPAPSPAKENLSALPSSMASPTPRLRATPRPTPRPTPKPTPKPTPAPTTPPEKKSETEKNPPTAYAARAMSPFQRT